MPSIPVVNPLGYVGVFLVIAGLFLAIAGLDLIKIEKITITPGRKTWGFGLLLATIGVLFLLPEISSAINSSAGPTAVVTVAPNMAPSPPTSPSMMAPIVQPTSVNLIPLVETPTSIPPTKGVATAPPQPIACITSQTGSGVPVEVQADTLTFGADDGLLLASGELIPFHSMQSFEAQEYSRGAMVTITLLNGEMVKNDVKFYFLYLSGTAKHGSFSIPLTDVKRVEFREQGGCQ
jgi:hypothetical protein